MTTWSERAESGRSARTPLRRLVRSEEHCRKLFEVAPDGIVLYDLDGKFVDGNKAAEALTGYCRDELIGQSFWTLGMVSAEELQNAARALQRNAAGEATGPAEYVLNRKDGGRVPVEIRTFPVEIEGQRLVLGIGRDISERKRAEERIRQLATIVEQSNDAIIGKSIDGIITSWNRGAERLYGYTEAEMLGQPISVLAAPGYEEKGTGMMAKMKRGDAVPPYEAVRRRKNGELINVSLALSAVRDQDGRVVGFSAIARDVTERKRTEQKLRQLASIVEHSNDAIFGNTLEGIVTSWNQGAQKLYGYTEEEMLGKPLSILCPPGKEHEPAEVMARARRGEPVENYEVVRRRKSGRLAHIALTLSPTRDADGQVVGVSVIARDITERKELEAQLRQAQKMEAVGQLAGGVAHDFNNLLAVMRGNAELLLLDAAGKDATETECLNQIVRAAERAASLTRQLLVFSRKQAMQARPLALDELVADVTKMLKRVMREDMALECRLGPQLPLVQADPGMMEQVLLNLAVNARDAMPKGGKLTILTEAVTLDAAAAHGNADRRPGDFVAMSVSDTGTGIAPEDLPRIFEPFFTTKEAGKGTGLGLSTVYGIVQQHQGWIEVSSQLGTGTTFKIYLPAIGRAARASRTDLQERVSGGTETILLVEDEYGVRMVTRRVLESHGYKVLEASSGWEALELWERHGSGISLLLTDMVMGDRVSGRELAEQLRARKPGLKVVFLSGYSTDVIGHNTTFFKRPDNYFLHKPCEAATLLKTVRECLDRP